jgi:hypothetical protein
MKRMALFALVVLGAGPAIAEYSVRNEGTWPGTSSAARRRASSSMRLPPLGPAPRPLRKAKPTLSSLDVYFVDQGQMPQIPDGQLLRPFHEFHRVSGC